MKGANQLVIEQPVEVIPSSTATAASTIKSILFHIHEDGGLEARLQTALSLARACSAHVHFLQVVPIEAYTVVDTFGGTFMSQEIVAALEEQADKVRSRLEDRLSREDISWTFEVKTSVAVPELLRLAALSDLLFLGREPRVRELSRTGASLAGEMVCRSRTPICVPGDSSASFDPFGPAVIAWNGSIEAANAVREIIGLLKIASDVHAIRFTEEKQTRFPDTSLVEYLSRHGVHATLETRTSRSGYAADLVEYASAENAAYMVMGGYGHSRASEFVFGGVTRELLHECPVSLVLGH